MNKAESKYFNTAVKFDEALLAILEKKSFEYISISEICKEAKVNRSTFYLHYENTCDLLNETTQYVMDKLTSYFGDDMHVSSLKYSECDLSDLNFISDKYLQPYLTFIKENRRLFSAVLSQPVTFKSELIFENLFDGIFNPILDRFNYPPDDRVFVMKFYLNGLTAIITEWLKSGCEKSTKEIVEIIRYCIFGRDDRWSIMLSQA